MADAIGGAVIVLRKGQRERRIVKIERISGVLDRADAVPYASSKLVTLTAVI